MLKSIFLISKPITSLILKIFFGFLPARSDGNNEKKRENIFCHCELMKSVRQSRGIAKSVDFSYSKLND
jgi:hypothetical protein